MAASAPDAVGNYDLWMYDAVRGLPTRFTFDPGGEYWAVFSPDRRSVIFNSTRKGHYDLYRKPANGAGAEELIYADDTDKVPTSWSHNGKFLLYFTGGGRRFEMFVLPLEPERLGDPLKPVPFHQTPFNEKDAQFSPVDDRWVMYNSDESGRDEIYVSPFLHRTEKHQISANGGILGRWRKDGKEIFYEAPNGQLMAAEIRDQRGNSRGRLDTPAADQVKLLRRLRLRRLRRWPARFGGDAGIEGRPTDHASRELAPGAQEVISEPPGTRSVSVRCGQRVRIAPEATVLSSSETRFYCRKSRGGQFLQKPGFRQSPVAHDCVGRDTHHVGRFLHSEPREKAQLDDASLPGSHAGQLVESVVQRDNLGRALRRHIQRLLDVNPLRPAAALGGHPLACAIDQDPPHQRGRHGEEVVPMLPIQPRKVSQMQIGLVNQIRDL